VAEKAGTTSDNVAIRPGLLGQTSRRQNVRARLLKGSERELSQVERTQETLMTLGRSQECWLCRPLALIVVLVVVGFGVACSPTATPTTPITPAPSGITHQVQVKDLETGVAIEGATVTLKIVEGPSMASVTTDEAGQASIPVDPSDAHKVGKLVVQASGYEDECQYIDLTKDSLPHVVFLKRKSETPIPTPASTAVSPTPVLMNTPVPSPTFTPMPHPQPTDTPTSPPTLTSTPRPLPTATFTPIPTPPIALSIRDLWPFGTACEAGGGWSADLWVQPIGGNGVYKYYADGVLKVGPTTEGATIHFYSPACSAIVGTMTVESGGQVVSHHYFIDVPDCCK